MNYKETVAARHSSLLAAEEKLKAQGVRTLQVQFPDMQGRINSRLSPLDIGAESHMVNSSTYILTPNCGLPLSTVVYESPYVWFDTGFKNIRAIPDPDTLVVPDWHPETANIMLDAFDDDGSPYMLDPRAALRRAEEKLTSMGMSARFGAELEFYLFHRNDELLDKREFTQLRTFGQGQRYLDVCRSPVWREFSTKLMDRMEQLGAPVYGSLMESGPGVYEVSLAPLSPLKAADALTRLRHHLKELCMEYDLIPTFMPRYHTAGKLQACGIHYHQSLCDKETGSNLFSGQDRCENPLSPMGLHYIGGQLATMEAFHYVFRPTMNSHRRLARGSGMPEDICWGVEHRCVSIRAIRGHQLKQSHIEHRCCGPDINPYLAIAAMLTGGIHGIENEINPGDPVQGDPGKVEGLKTLPRSLEDSIKAFRESDLPEKAFGKALADHYARTGENELKAFKEWIERGVTEFEYQRYFDAY